MHKDEMYLTEVKNFLSAAAFNVLREIVRKPGQTAKQIATALNNQPGQYLILLREAGLVESQKVAVNAGVKGKPSSVYTPTMLLPDKKVRAYKSTIPERPTPSASGDPKMIVDRLITATSDAMEFWPLNEIRLSLAQLQVLLKE